jgi:hypothetical protein
MQLGRHSGRLQVTVVTFSMPRVREAGTVTDGWGVVARIRPPFNNPGRVIISQMCTVLGCRYVIDFYNAAPLPTMPVAMHLDVRPALDSPTALYDRLRMQFRWVASGRWQGE